MSNPLDFVGGKKEEPKFVSASSMSKNQARSFHTSIQYRKFIDSNPYIDIISVIEFNDEILVTYKEGI